MKRIALLSLAVATAAGSAWAQSGAVSITGIIDAGVRVDSGTTGGSVTSVGSGLMAGSRLTFSGVEDLGDGLAASFVLESGLGIDTGIGNSNPPGVANGPLTFGRTSAVAVGSERTGYVSLGRQYTPLWALSAGPANDPFGGTWLGGIGTVYSTTVRASNAIVYSYGYTARTMLLPAPRSGLGFAAMWSLSEASSPQPSASGQQLGFNVSYGDGKWWAGYAYHQVRGSNPSINATAPVTDQPKVTQQTLAASYDFGIVRVHGGLNRGSNALSGTGALDRSNWHLGASLPFGGNQAVRVLYGRANDRTAVNADFSTFQLGYQYDLSKRTMLYTAIGQVDNSATASASLLAPAGAYANGAKARSVIAGIRHNF